LKRVLIVEDIADTRAWLRGIVAEVFVEAAIVEAANLAAADTASDRESFDLLLCDLNLPDGFGADFIARFKPRHPQALCVVATTFDDDEHLFPALQAGADGYLLKGLPRSQIAGLLQGITNGQPPLSPSIARRLMEYFKPAVPPTPPECLELTPRECETLLLIAKGLSLKEVARLLNISQHTVGGYVKEVYRKLGICSRAEAALEASRMGLFRGD